MKKTNLDSKQNNKMLENKTKRNPHSWKRRWKPYKDLTYAEKKMLEEKAEIKDYYKQVSL